MMSSKGFTLIELVVVIIILGILSVTAAPRMLNLQRDARLSVMQATKAALITTLDIVYYKAVLQGQEKVYKSDTMVGDVPIRTYYGFAHEIWENKLELLMDHNFTYLGNVYNDHSVLEKVCQDNMCVADQIPMQLYVPGTAGTYGLAFAPKGKSLRDSCLIAYYFYANKNNISTAEKHVIMQEDGC